MVFVISTAKVIKYVSEPAIFIIFVAKTHILW